MRLTKEMGKIMNDKKMDGRKKKKERCKSG
jgi:hypothetical protein